MRSSVIRTLVVLVVLLAASAAGAARVKDIARVNGLDGEHLIGYGIVVGLNGTGDGSRTGFTSHSVAGMMEKFGITLSPDEIKLKNVAAVMLTGTLPPFSRRGGSLDVTVSSLGDASSLEGGILLMTPMIRQADGLQYAVAQGPLSTGGFSVDAGGGNSSRKNNSNVGRIPGGATLTRDWDGEYVRDNRLDLVLHSPDFTTASNVARKINGMLGGELASALPDPALYAHATEEELWNQARNLEPRIAELTAARDFVPAIEALLGLRPVIDRFFDDVLVMDKDEAIKANRLRLLLYVRSLGVTRIGATATSVILDEAAEVLASGKTLEEITPTEGELGGGY